MTTFAQQLKPLLEPLSDTREAQIARAAAICGVSPRTIYLWLAGQGNPNAATKAGTLALLAAAGKSNAGGEARPHEQPERKDHE